MNAWARAVQSPRNGWSARGRLKRCRFASPPKRPSKTGWSEATETALRREAITRHPTEVAIRPR
jgi:hypothetical protein